MMASVTPPARFDGPEGGVFIGKGTQVVGEILDCSKVVIRGRIEGNIDTVELVIEEEGSLKGNIKAEQIEVHGKIDGNAVVSNLADIRSTGMIVGELVYGQLSVAAGGQVHGTIRQSGDQRTPVQKTTSRSSEKKHEDKKSEDAA
jgi:cytoskeletal protein CcmA (bactofilin family)